MTYKEKLKAKLKEQSDLLNKALAENRVLDDAEQALMASLEKEISDLEKMVELQNKTEERAKAASTPVNEPIFATPKNPDEKKWNSLGEYFVAVKNASSPGGSMDKRLFMDAASGNNTNVGADGGFLIEKEFRSDLMDAMKEDSNIAKDITMVPIGANKNGLKWADIEETSRADGYRHGGALVYWAAEAETVSSSKVKLVKSELELEKVMGFWYATSELLDDATAMEALAKMEFANAMSFAVDDKILWGTGAGVPLGIMNSNALISIAKEAGQGADTILHENVDKMWNQLDSKSWTKANWYINQEAVPQLKNMTLTIGTSGVMSPYSKEYYEKGTICGRPVKVIEQASKLGDKGDIILADPTKYLGIDKNGVQADVSVHVKFLYDESCFRFIYRMNGAPRKNYSKASYKNASFSTSPFVTLAERA